MSTFKDRQKRRTRIAVERIDDSQPPPVPTLEDIRERLKHAGALLYLCLDVPRSRRPAGRSVTLLSRSGPKSCPGRGLKWDGKRLAVTAHWSVASLRAWVGDESRYTWTGDDAAFVGRVDVAVSRLTVATTETISYAVNGETHSHGAEVERAVIPVAAVEEWQECCRRWGPRSRSALGCLLGLVRVAWGCPVQVNPPRTGPVWLIYIITGEGEDQSSQLMGREQTEHLGLLAALEAAPR